MRSATYGLPAMQGVALHRMEQAAWYIGGVALGFLAPFVFSSWMDLPNDAYYAIYFASVAVFLGLYARATHLDVRAFFTRNWKWSLALGALASGFVVWNVLAREDSTPRPDGAYFVFTLAWRGVLYGVVDALLLTAFPLAVAIGVLGRATTFAKRAEVWALAFALMFVVTAAYHLGYEQYREDGVGRPEVGNTVISVPGILTANPLGSVVAHASMHVAADAHAYETETFLPPATDAD